MSGTHDGRPAGTASPSSGAGDQEATASGPSATLTELVERARALAASGGRRILGLVGAPGAGKSSVAEHIVAALGPDLAVGVPMDGFHLAGPVLEALGRTGRKGAPDTFDGAGFVHLLRRIRSQAGHPIAGGASGDPGGLRSSDHALDGVVFAPVFRRELEEPVAGAIAVMPAVPLVVTEGNYLLLDREPWSEVTALLDESWFLAPPEGLRHERLVRRHERFGRSPGDARQRAFGSDEDNAHLIRGTAARATAVIRLGSRGPAEPR